MNDPLTRPLATAIGQTVNKPASTIYRWRQDNPALFQAVREYAARRGVTPSVDDAYQAGYDATGLGISDCPFVTIGMTPEDKRLADAWLDGRTDATHTNPREPAP